jgi:hypothetical protein
MAGGKDNLHRETLRAALRVIQTSEALEAARIQLARLLNVLDRLEAKGIEGEAAVTAGVPLKIIEAGL